MRNRTLMPQARQDMPRERLEWDISPQARERWTPELMAAAPETESTISILDPIGFDPWDGSGVTAKRIAAALRAIGPGNDVTVNLNSPGGDLFEGLAIYNLLREHDGAVTVKVLGLAASAASIVAMAGDEIMIARAGFMMIHDTWVLAVGNRNDLRDIADMLEPFDEAMADIYAARTGLDADEVQKMMDRETWIGGSAAVDQGFADKLLPSDEVSKQARAAVRPPAQRIETALAKAGMPRSERRSLIQELKAGMPRAAGAGTPRATEDGKPSAADAGQVLLAQLRAFQIDPTKETT